MTDKRSHSVLQLSVIRTLEHEEENIQLSFPLFVDIFKLVFRQQNILKSVTA